MSYTETTEQRRHQRYNVRLFFSPFSNASTVWRLPLLNVWMGFWLMACPQCFIILHEFYYATGKLMNAICMFLWRSRWFDCKVWWLLFARADATFGICCHKYAISWWLVIKTYGLVLINVLVIYYRDTSGQLQVLYVTSFSHDLVYNKC